MTSSMRLIQVAVCFLLTLATYPAIAADSNPWAMTFDQFRKAVNEAELKDNVDDAEYADTIANCSGGANKICTFNDKGFQHGIHEMKKLNLMNGKFKFHLTLKANINSGKVSQIGVYGDRSDPVNLFRYIGTVLNVVKLFDPQAVNTDEKLANMTEQLGLMRGDSASDIGRPRTVIEDYAAITCISLESNESTNLGCVFEPRS